MIPRISLVVDRQTYQDLRTIAGHENISINAVIRRQLAGIRARAEKIEKAKTPDNLGVGMAEAVERLVSVAPDNAPILIERLAAHVKARSGT